MNELAWLTSLPALIVIGVLGMLIHFFKKQIRGETLVEIRDYFKDHFKSTFTAAVVTVVSVVAYYLSLATEQPADIVVAFLLGFGFDSTLNKWEGKIQNGG